VPIVARGPFTAAPDLVVDGVDGLVVEPSAPAFADALTALLADGARLEALSLAARHSGAARDWDGRARDMEQVYTDLCATDAVGGTERSPEWL